MKCRTVIAALLLVFFVRAVAAEPASKAWRVGWVGNGSAATVDRSIGDLRQALQDLGYVEGKSLVIESRSSSSCRCSTYLGQSLGSVRRDDPRRRIVSGPEEIT